MKRFLAWVVAGALGCSAAFAEAPAGNAFVPVAHSTDLAVEGSVAAGALTLRVQGAGGKASPRVTDLAVRLDGRPLAVMARADGTWAAPLEDLAAHTAGKLEIIVAHDGALEALDGQLPGDAVAPSAGNGTLSALIHKQASWWVLNIIIVLVGVVAVSRRMS